MSDNTTLNPGTGGDISRSIHRAGGSGPKTQVVQLDAGGGGATESLVTDLNPLPVKEFSATRSDTFTTTGNGVTVDASTKPCTRFGLQVKGTSVAPTAWSVVLEGSLNNVQFTTLIDHGSAGQFGAVADGATVWTEGGPFLYFRSRCASLTLGSATNVIATIVGK